MGQQNYNYSGYNYTMSGNVNSNYYGEMPWGVQGQQYQQQYNPYSYQQSYSPYMNNGYQYQAGVYFGR